MAHPHADQCPSCGQSVEPYDDEPWFEGREWTAAYDCRCGKVWTKSWDSDFRLIDETPDLTADDWALAIAATDLSPVVRALGYALAWTPTGIDWTTGSLNGDDLTLPRFGLPAFAMAELVATGWLVADGNQYRPALAGAQR